MWITFQIEQIVPLDLRQIARKGLLGFAVVFGAPIFAQELDFQVSGQDDQLARALRAGSATVAALGDETSNLQDRLAAARSDYEKLLGLAYAKGYFGATVSVRADQREVATLSPFAPPSRVSRIAIRVDPGTQFRFGTVRIAPRPDDSVQPDTISPDAPASSTALSAAARSAISDWRDAGYATAAVTDQTATADHRSKRLDATLRIAPGPRLRFGQFTVSGNQRTRPDRVRSIAGMPTGRVFSPEEMGNMTRRLRDTGAFDSVSLGERAEGGQLNVDVDLVESPLRRIGAGAEISTDRGLALTGFWLHRNLLRGAERLRFDISVENIWQDGNNYLDGSFATTFRRPGTLAPDTDLLLGFEIKRENQPASLSDNAVLSVGLERRISRDLSGGVAVEYMQERLNKRPGVDEFRVFSAPLRVGLDTRDDRLDPSDGALVSAELRPFLGWKDAENGVRLYLDARGYRALGTGGRMVLAGRLQFGSVSGSSIAATPSDFLFLSGGSGTVRGRGYEDLGTLATGRKTGGRSFLGASVEARYGVTDTIGLVGFYDIGYVGAESLPNGSGAAHDGIGIGARYKTPIGPIRLDVATPAFKGGNGLQIYIGIGQAF